MPLSSNVYLNSDTDSFAHVSLTVRWPALIGTAVDDVRLELAALPEGQKKQQGVQLVEDMLAVQRSVASDAIVEPIIAEVPDRDIYNRFITVDGQRQQWSAMGWLDSECLVYRKLQIALEAQPLWRGFDYFARAKNDTFVKSAHAVSTLAERYHKVHVQLATRPPPEVLELLAHELFSTALWGNATDLSLLVTVSMEQLKELQVSAANRDKESLLVNDFKKVWHQLRSDAGGRVDIVLDNSGFELYTDLVLTLFLLDSGLAEQVVLHPKNLPWMVSDVVPSDLPAILGLLADATKFPLYRDDLDFIVHKLHDYLAEGQLIMRTSAFWTTPLPFSEIRKGGEGGGEAVYKDLRASKLVVFKGDLNYRKLTADKVWPYDTPFEVAIGDLAQSHIPLVALRTVKADVIVGLPAGKGEELDKQWKEEHPSDRAHAWSWGGKYAVISFYK